MSNVKKIDIDIDVLPLQKKLIDNPNFFGLISDRIDADSSSPHRESSDIWVRYGDIFGENGKNVLIEEHDSVWYPIIDDLQEVLPIAFKLMTKVHGERLGGVLITKLEKGKKVYPHVDTEGWHPGYYDKFYVPILNKDGAVFGFEDDGEINAKEGEAYWFRNDIPHWVNNNSDSDRIAMVVCIKPFRGLDNEQ